MNLVKWLRKNRTKVMAVVVVGTLLGFIGGSALTYLLSPSRSLGYKAIAYFGDNKKIKDSDLSLARTELEILRLLGADELLKAQDLRGFLLAELLFSEGRPSAALTNQLRQVIRSNRLNISDKQINDIYKRTAPSHIYWLLLKNEALSAGINVTNTEVGELLGRTIPQLFDGQTYTQRIKVLIDRYGIPEDQLLSTFGKLLVVLQYAHLACSDEDVTVSQVMRLASCESETITVELVKFDAATFADTQKQPGEEEMLEHFNKYKEIFAGDVSEENPYGFGYKLLDRAQLEYIAVKLDNISSIVTPPTAQEAEDYYRKHQDQLKESVPQDPNDPNSPLVEEAKKYAEVASSISKQLLRDKINSKAESILQEARILTEAEERDPSLVTREPSDERRATDYKTAADKLAEKYKIKIYTGQTGQLSGADMDADEHVRRLYMMGQGRNPVRLRQIIFSMDELQTDPNAGPALLDWQRPKLLENIGPVRDMLTEIMLLIRVTKAQKTSAPESIDSILDTRSLMLDDNRESSIEHQVSAERRPVERTVKQNVADDLKKLAVINNGLVRTKAEEFIAMAAKEGWESTLKKFNNLYPRHGRGERPLASPAAAEPNQSESDPNSIFFSSDTAKDEVFKVESLSNLRRIPMKTRAVFEAQSEGAMGEQLYVQEVKKWLSVNGVEIQSRFVDQLYSLVPKDSSAAEGLPLLMEFKPEMSFYVIKDILVKRLGLAEYEKLRAGKFFREDQLQSQSMAPVHFNPENILKRMKFRLAKQQDETKAEPEGAL